MALVLREPPVKVGKGDKTYKTLTAAVKAAEREKEEARGMVRLAAAQVDLAKGHAGAARESLFEAGQFVDKARRVQAQAIGLCVFWAALALIALGVQVAFIIF